MMVTQATRTVLQRLKRFFQPLRASPSLGALALPTEIILMMAAHLNTSSGTTSSGTALALTCRTIYCICFPKHPIQDIEEKDRALTAAGKGRG